MEIEPYKLHQILQSAAELGALNALKKVGLYGKDEISQREAYRRFGEANVKKWKHLGRIKRIKTGLGNHKATYSVAELESIYSAEKLAI
ncbi:MAG: hypothetical protein KGZ82_04460 [Bacteroidales bacterium]|nr:hypothetical protein [Bacteroidales bacterium]